MVFAYKAQLASKNIILILFLLVLSLQPTFYIYTLPKATLRWEGKSMS